MKVIAITERGEDYAKAVVKIPEGESGEDVFISWMRKRYDCYDKTVDEIHDMNTEYAFAELPLLEYYDFKESA